MEGISIENSPYFYPMKISTLPTPGAALTDDFDGKTVVVIDVLRATSTIITALTNGAKEVIPVVEIKEALSLKTKYHPSEVLLCGERSAGIIPGFDLGNSPFDYSTERVQNRTLIMSTTNGTKAIRKAEGAKKLLLASFINGEEVVHQVKESDELVLLCSGTNGRFSMDDALCAGYMATLLDKTTTIEACDLTRTLMMAWQSLRGKHVEAIKTSIHGKLLIRKGYEKDLEYCMQTGITHTVPQYNSRTNSIKTTSLATY